MLPEQVVLDLPVSSSTIESLIDFDSMFYNVNPSLVRGIVKRESNFNQYAVGDHGTSFGLVQLHDIASKGITLTEAYSPIYAINYLTSQLAAGRGSQWSTYKAALASLSP